MFCEYLFSGSIKGTTRPWWPALRRPARGSSLLTLAHGAGPARPPQPEHHIQHPEQAGDGVKLVLARRLRAEPVPDEGVQLGCEAHRALGHPV